MITNEELLEKYKDINKVYVPEEYVKEQYKYVIDSDNIITIITNENCYTNYNTEYCDCYKYNINQNIISKGNPCNRNQATGIISNEKITNDINYNPRIIERYYYDNILSIIMIATIILIVTMFKKNSRNI